MRPVPDNPILVRRFRGIDEEAWHRGAYCVMRGSDVVAAAGAIDHPYFMRSGAKFFQAVPGVLSGIVDRFELPETSLALMCASHGGEPMHVEVARDMLGRGGLSERDLQCGAHAPLHKPSAKALERAQEAPTTLHNNCSGKHAGMLLATLCRGEPTPTYLQPEHPLQREIHGVLCEFAECSQDEVTSAIDGCSAPTFILSLRNSAKAYRNFAAPPTRLGDSVRSATRRLWAAVSHHPLLLAGHDRFCSAVCQVTQGDVIVKVGAEGFYGIMCPRQEIGAALHMDDGAVGASERVTARLLHRLGLITDEQLEALQPHVYGTRRNHGGLPVGRVEIDLPNNFAT